MLYEVITAIVDKSGTLVGHSDPVLAMQRLNLNDHPEVRRALDGVEATVEGRHRNTDLLESVARIQPLSETTTVIGSAVV